METTAVSMSSVRVLLREVEAEDEATQVRALGHLSQLLETHEQRYRSMVGDHMWVTYSDDRLNYTIGRVVNCIREHDDTFHRVVVQAMDSRASSPRLRTACLRLVNATLQASEYEYPASDDDFIEQCQVWAQEGADSAPVEGDAPPADEDQFQREAFACFALGCVSVAMQNAEWVNHVMTTPFVPFLTRALSCHARSYKPARTAGSSPPHAPDPPRAVDPSRDKGADHNAGCACPHQDRASCRSGGSADRSGARASHAPAEARTPALRRRSAAQTCASAASCGGARFEGAAQAPGTERVVRFVLPDAGASYVDELYDGDLATRAAVLRRRRLHYVLNCLFPLAECLDILPHVLQDDSLGACMALMRGAPHDDLLLTDTLRLASGLIAHRRFCELFLDVSGLKFVLSLPRNQHTSVGISLILYGIASVAPVFERVCKKDALVHALLVVSLALLKSSLDGARRNAVLFLGEALRFRACLEEFERHEGLRKLLNVLRLSVRAYRRGAEREDSANMKVERQVAHQAVQCFRTFFKAQIVLHVARLLAKLSRHGPMAAPVPSKHKALDISRGNMLHIARTIARDERLCKEFLRERFPAVDAFVSEMGGHVIITELIQPNQPDRYAHEMVQYALEVLWCLTLCPHTRTQILGPAAPSPNPADRPFMPLLLSALSGQAFFHDIDISSWALQVLRNCVAVWPALQGILPKDRAGDSRPLAPPPGDRYIGRAAVDAQAHATGHAGEPSSAPPAGRGDFAAALRLIADAHAHARNALRRFNGIRILMTQLRPRAGLLTPEQQDFYTNICYVLQGLCIDPNLRKILATLGLDRVLCVLMKNCSERTSEHRPSRMGEVGSSESSQEEFQGLVSDIMSQLGGLSMKGAAAVAATDATTPALRKLECTAIANSTHITYNPRELLILIHEHLLASGMPAAASTLAMEAGLLGGAPAGSGAPPHASAASAATAASMPASGAPADARRRPPLRLSDNLVSEGLLAQSGRIRATSHSSSRACSPTKTSPPHSRSPSPDADGGHSLAGAGTSSAKRQLDDAEGAAHQDAQQSSRTPPLKRRRWILDPHSQGYIPPAFTPHVASLHRVWQLDEPAAAAAGPTPPTAGAPSSSAGFVPASADALVRSLSREGRDAAAAAAFRTGSAIAAEAAKLRSAFLKSAPQGFTPSPAGAGIDVLPDAVVPVKPAATERKDQTWLMRQLLGGLPSRRRKAVGAQREARLPLENKASIGPPHVLAALESASSMPLASSRLNAIVLRFLRNQHRQACLQAPCPVSSLPPISLLKTHILPVPLRWQAAPYNLAARRARQETTPPYGGLNGLALDRRFVYSRFRPRAVFRDESSYMCSCASVGTNGKPLLALGSVGGELKVYDFTAQAVVAEADEVHPEALTVLDARQTGPDSTLLLSSCRAQTKLWAMPSLAHERMSWPSVYAARFNLDGSFMAAVGTAGVNHPLGIPAGAAALFDITRREPVMIFEQPESIVIPGDHFRINPHISFSRYGDLFLLGPLLYDIRSGTRVHHFDLFTDTNAACSFHPNGTEVILNSEVWDTRMLKLMRSVPLLDGCEVSFNASGNIIYAIQKRQDPTNVRALVRRSRKEHPLFTSFATLDAHLYQELCRNDLGFPVLDLCCRDNTQQFVSAVTMDLEGDQTCARLFAVGRKPPGDDDSDVDEGNEEDDLERQSEDGGSDEAGDFPRAVMHLAASGLLRTRSNDSDDVLAGAVDIDGDDLVDSDGEEALDDDSIDEYLSDPSSDELEDDEDVDVFAAQFPPTVVEHLVVQSSPAVGGSDSDD